MASLPLARWTRLRSVFHSAASLGVVALLLAGGFWGGHLLSPGHSGEEPDDGETATPSAEPAAVVTLSEQKLAAAGIHASRLERREIGATKTVTGTIDYDPARHLSLNAPVDCVVERLLVKPGQLVAQGDPLAALSSTEIALARLEIEKAEAEVRIARIEHEIVKEKHDNLIELLAVLENQPTIEEIEVRFDGAALGEYRHDLLASYSQLLLASNLSERLKPLDKQGLIPGRTAEERASQREIAAATFKTAREEANHESKRQFARAEAAYDIAQRQSAVCRERLRLLLGPFADDSAGESESEFEVRAPFAGRIEGFTVAPASRVAKGEELLHLADAGRLWVSALVHQHDWDALKLAQNEIVRVSVPAIPGETFEARVSFIGPEVSRSTRAVPLIAELDNAAGRFRPGMFAWVSLPMEAPRQGLAVSPASIQRHESQAFVFVEQGEREFRRVDVTTGLETPEYVEILAGLTEGQMIVDGGAFYLKSELLLEE